MKKVITIFLSGIILSLCLVSCGTPKIDNYIETDRFKVALNQGFNKIYVDTETGVMYYLHSNRGGLTVMVDENGKPLIWEE